MELRPFDESHEGLLELLQQQDDVWELIGTLPLAAYESGNHVFVIQEGEDELGFVGLFKSQAAGQEDFELVCATRSEVQHHGVAKQACQVALDWALTSAKLERVIACIDAANQPARAIATKLGMTELALAMPASPARSDRIIYAKYRDAGMTPVLR